MKAALLLSWLVGCGPIYPAPQPQPQPQPDPTGPTQPAPVDPPQEPPPREIEPASRPPATGPAPLVSSGKPRPTSMGTQAELAAHKHWEGEELYRKQRYAEASARFREAVARVPESRYFYNLCASLYMEGKFGEALTACSAVQRNNPTVELRDRADALAIRIQDEARAQGINLTPP